MIIVPAVVGLGVIVYALGGVGQTLIILESIAQDSWQWLRNLV